MLPGPRFLICSECSEAPKSVYFQEHPGASSVRHVGSCGRCPGNLCSALVNVSQAYLSTLTVSEGFSCDMVQGPLPSAPGVRNPRAASFQAYV